MVRKTVSCISYAYGFPHTVPVTSKIRLKSRIFYLLWLRFGFLQTLWSRSVSMKNQIKYMRLGSAKFHFQVYIVTWTKSLSVSTCVSYVNKTSVMNRYSTQVLNMSARTTAANVQDIIEARLEKRTKGNYVPAGGKDQSMIVIVSNSNQ